MFGARQLAVVEIRQRIGGEDRRRERRCHHNGQLKVGDQNVPLASG